MSTQVLPPAVAHELSQAVTSAMAAKELVLGALEGLVKALGMRKVVKMALEKAEEVMIEADVVLERLQRVRNDAVAALAPEATPPMEIDPRAEYEKLVEMANAGVHQLTEELQRNLKRQRVLKVLRNIAVGLMAVCAPLLSLDAVREALKVTQENHIVPCLSTITLLCQVALIGTKTAEKHLTAALRSQEKQAERYQQLVNDVIATTRATEKANEAITAVSDSLRPLQKVIGHLKKLVGAIKLDLRFSSGFLNSTKVLGDILEDLGTVLGDKQGKEMLGQVAQALPGDK